MINQARITEMVLSEHAKIGKGKHYKLSKADLVLATPDAQWVLNSEMPHQHNFQTYINEPADGPAIKKQENTRKRGP